jgi:hypothetical protein
MWAYPYTSYNQSSAVPESCTLLPDYLACVSLQRAPDNCKRGWGSFHAGNAIQFAQCDGSITSVSQDIDIDLFCSMATVADAGAQVGSGAASLPPSR